MNHDQIVLWIDQNAEYLFEKITGLNAVPAKRWEKPLYGTGGIQKPSAFIDIELYSVHIPIYEKKTTNEQYTCIWFEAKTTINSVGELFRQLNRYASLAERRHNMNYADKLFICVVSPDVRFKKIIEEQGYLFIEPFGEQNTLF